MKIKLLVLLIPLMFFSCKKNIVDPDTLTNNPRQSVLDNEIHELVKKYNDKLGYVGIEIGVLKDSIFHFYGYGETQIGSGSIPNQFTFYEIGSITKVFTAITTVNFLNSQNLTTEAFVNDYLPDDIPDFQSNNVKVNFKHIMTHTSGFPGMPANLGFVAITDLAKAWEEYDSNKLYEYLKVMNLKNTPGTEWEYSNLAVGTLGKILERVYGKTYGEIIDSIICTPLNLYDTKAVLNADQQQRMAKCYDGFKETDYWSDLNALNGAGVLKSTASDLLKFAQANFITVAENSLDSAMLQCQKEYYYDEQYVRMGLGWLIVNLASSNDTSLYHNGGTGGFRTELIVFKNKKIAICVLYNNTEKNKDVGLQRQYFTKELIDIVLAN